MSCGLVWNGVATVPDVPGRPIPVRLNQFLSISSNSHHVCLLQGSILGRVLFLLYTDDLTLLIHGHDIGPHLYADDTQIYGSRWPSSSVEIQNTITNCINNVASWMRSNSFQQVMVASSLVISRSCLKDSSILLPITLPFSCRAQEVTRHYRHVNRVFPYFVTYLPVCRWHNNTASVT